MSERIQLEDLRPAEGATHRPKRKGRGRATGMGKTCCRGHNGEGQRAGRSKKPGFEGGQMPGYRKFPKLKGFKSLNPIKFAEINIAELNELDMPEITIEALIESKRFSQSYDELRVLGKGELSKAVTVKAAYFTASAKQKIEAAGGKAEVV